MKVAIFVRDDKMKRLNINAMHVLIFNLENDKIIGMEDDYLYKKDPNYISLWLITRKIRIIYVQDIDNASRNYFKSIGIAVKTLEDISNDHIFRVFFQ